MARDDLRLTGITDANGDCVVSWRPFARQVWTVDQVSTEAPGIGTDATCGLYKDGFRISPILPAGSVVDGPPPTIQRNGSTMSVVWSGANPDIPVKVFVQYDDGT